jgi:hypothetical protein
VQGLTGSVDWLQFLDGFVSTALGLSGGTDDEEADLLEFDRVAAAQTGLGGVFAGVEVLDNQEHGFSFGAGCS